MFQCSWDKRASSTPWEIRPIHQRKSHSDGSYCGLNKTFTWPVFGLVETNEENQSDWHSQVCWLTRKNNNSYSRHLEFVNFCVDGRFPLLEKYETIHFPQIWTTQLHSVDFTKKEENKWELSFLVHLSCDSRTKKETIILKYQLWRISVVFVFKRSHSVCHLKSCVLSLLHRAEMRLKTPKALFRGTADQVPLTLDSTSSLSTCSIGGLAQFLRPLVLEIFQKSTGIFYSASYDLGIVGLKRSG